MPQYKVTTSKMDPKDAVIISKTNNKHIVTQANFNISFKGKEEKVRQVKNYRRNDSGAKGCVDGCLQSLLESLERQQLCRDYG